MSPRKKNAGWSQTRRRDQQEERELRIASMLKELSAQRARQARISEPRPLMRAVRRG